MIFSLDEILGYILFVFCFCFVLFLFICFIVFIWFGLVWFFFFFFPETELSLGYPGTHSVEHAVLELRNLPASAFQVLGLKVCATTTQLIFVLVFCVCVCVYSCDLEFLFVKMVATYFKKYREHYKTGYL